MSLVSIQRIIEIKNHPNADLLSLATVLGWQIVVKKDEFKQGDLCVFIPIDTIVPIWPEFEFLRNKDFRVRAIKLRGEISQGLALPMSAFNWAKLAPLYIGFKEGDELDDIIPVKHYEKAVPAQLAGTVKGNFPSWLKKTDELNLRSYPRALEELQGQQAYLSQKVDGCLDGSTVVITEGGDKTIKEICDQHYKGKVLTYDISTGCEEYQAILSYSIKSKVNDWYELETECGLVLKVTGNHLVWLPDLHCYRKVSDLSQNDVILLKN